jgi:uncharacterized protein YqhQ
MFIARKGSEEGHSLSSPSVDEKRGKPLRVGGQAVIEGVMMRSPHSMAIAVRRPNGEIVVKRKGLSFFSERSLFFKFPLARGVLALISALVLGIEALNFSANQAFLEEEKPPSVSAFSFFLWFLFS